MAIVDDLKNKAMEAEAFVKTTDANRQIWKEDVRIRERELKKSKKNLGIATRQWQKAKKDLEKARRKVKTYPSQLRSWGRKNPDKILNYLENG